MRIASSGNICAENPKADFILFWIETEKVQVVAQWKNHDKIFCKRKARVVVVTWMDLNTRNTDWRETCHGIMVW